MNNDKGGIKVYKPKLYGQKEMESGLKGLFGRNKQQQPRQSTLDEFGLKTGQPARQPQQQTTGQQHGLNIPNYFGKPQPLVQQQQPVQQPQPQEEAPYWSAEQWEDWAISMYENVEESRQFLPEWVIKAMESQG